MLDQRPLLRRGQRRPIAMPAVAVAEARAAVAGSIHRRDPRRAVRRRPGRIDPDLYGRLFCVVTAAGAAADCPAGVPPMNGTCDGGPCLGNGTGGHRYGTTLPAGEKRALVEHLKTF